MKRLTVNQIIRQRVPAVNTSTREREQTDVTITNWLSKFKTVTSGIRNGTQTEKIVKIYINQVI